MPTKINLRQILHRKAMEAVCPLVSAFAAGGFLCGGKQGIVPHGDTFFHVQGASSIYLYSPGADSFQQLPNSGAAGTFAAGSCGEYQALGMPGGSPTTTASGTGAAFATAPTIPTARTFARDLRGCLVRCIAGTNAGYESTIASNTIGANSVITCKDPAPANFDATSVIEIYSGALWFFNAGTTAVGLSVYDRATNAWTAKSVTSLPTAWGTTGQLCSTQAMEGGREFGQASSGGASALTDSSKAWAVDAWKHFRVKISSGTGAGQVRRITANTATALTTDSAWVIQPDATSQYEIYGGGFAAGISTGSNTTTTLNDTGRAWPVNAWANYQARIVAGTGAGQVRAIASNTATSLTVASAWATTPDATSIYVIEAANDALYLLGNAAVTVYKYSISGNTWATITPGTARAAAMSGGGTADWIGYVDDPLWKAPTPGDNRQGGRYIYSWRGGASALMDRYDIAANTWINGAAAGSAGAYGNQGETFTTGSCSVDNNRYIYLYKEATGRLFRFDVVRFCLEPWMIDLQVQSTTVEGDRLVVVPFRDGPTTATYVYMARHGRNDFGRVLEIPDAA